MLFSSCSVIRAPCSVPRAPCPVPRAPCPVYLAPVYPPSLTPCSLCLGSLTISSNHSTLKIQGVGPSLYAGYGVLSLKYYIVRPFAHAFISVISRPLSWFYNGADAPELPQGKSHAQTTKLTGSHS